MAQIIIVDDNPEHRWIAAKVLRREGFEVHEAASGEAALGLAEKSPPDLILSDVHMAGLDGYDVIQQLRLRPGLANVPVILMTGEANFDGMRQGMTVGADDYLPKPFSAAQLVTAVRMRLDKHRELMKEAEAKIGALREQIVMMVPHELLTPLNGILGFAHLMQEESGRLGAAEIREYARAIEQSGERLHELVKNVLIFAQLEAIQVHPQRIEALRNARTENPGNVVERIAREQATSTERVDDLIVKREEEDSAGSVKMGSEYVAKIVQEAIANAFKFSRRGTPVTVLVRHRPEDFWVSISDQGCGMTTEQLSRVGAYVQFDRRLHAQNGAGLGLAIARSLAQLHEGSMTITSSLNQGTQVSIRLPVSSGGSIVADEPMPRPAYEG